MIGFIITIMCISSVICAISLGNTNELSGAAVDSCSQAVQLAIYLAGSMALWGGLMEIADKSGLTDKFVRLLQPITRFLFRGISSDKTTEKAVTMNIAANMLGLGNAATPLGIAAIKRINSHNGKYSRKHIAMLVVLNSASIQLIPTTIGALRQSHGAKSPFDVTPAIIITSLISAAAGCIMVYALSLTERKKNETK